MDWGASVAQWEANHHPDPITGPGNWWPRYPNGLDEYTNVSLSGPRVVSYTLNLYPAMALPQALARVRDELPPASTVLRSQPVPAAAPSCLVALIANPVLASRLGTEVEAVLHSAGPSWDPADVVSISLAPYPLSGGPPLVC